MSKKNNNFSWKDSITLKEYFDGEIADIERMLDLRFQATQKAVELQAKEYERRLDFLNGEAERLRHIQATYLPREVYEENRREIMSCIKQLEEFKNNSLGRQAILTIVVSAIISFAFIIFNYLLLGTK